MYYPKAEQSKKLTLSDRDRKGTKIMSKSHLLVNAQMHQMLKKVAPAFEHPLCLSVSSDLDGLGFAKPVELHFINAILPPAQ